MTEGTSEETFSPHEKVTREQAATFLYRYATNVLGFWFTLEGDLSGYTDEDRISEFAAEAILWATDAGIFQGFPDGTFQPQGRPDPGAACQDPDGFEPVRRQLFPLVNETRCLSLPL